MSAAFWARLHGRISALRGWRAWASAALLGASAAAALPPVYAVFLLIPAFVGWIWMAEAATRKRTVLVLGWWFGFGHFAAGFYWIANALLVQPERYAWMIPFAVGGLAALMAAFPAVTLLCARLLSDRLRLAGPGRILMLAAAWTAFEWVRSWFLTGFPWNLLGTVWAFSDSMSQFAALTGVYGLGTVTLIAAAMPAVLTDPRTDRRRGVRAVVAAFGVLALVVIGGAVRLAGDDGATVPNVRLRLVQPNIPQKIKWRSDLLDGHLARQLILSRRPPKAGDPRPTHILWAETAAPFFVGRDAARRELIGRIAPPDGIVLLGAPRITPRGEKPVRVWNSLRAVDPTGAIVGTYDKAHLVPFGEYVPFRKWIDIPKITAGRTDFSAGPGVQTLHLPGIPPVGPLICYEIIFPGAVADPTDRPHWLLNLTNDGWYGRSAGPYQHLATAKFRAIEEGLPVVRVAYTGISAVINPFGREIARIDLQTEDFVDSNLPQIIAHPTVYARIGNFSILITIVMVVFLATIKYRE